MHRARIAIFRSDRRGFMTGCGFFLGRRLFRVSDAALFRHERRQRRDLAKQPGKRHRANATPECGHVRLQSNRKRSAAAKGATMNRRMRKAWICAGMAVFLASCTDRSSPVAPTTIAGPTPALTVPSLPTTVPGVLALSLPIDAGDFASGSFGITPFGTHGPDHAEDGHQGWDIEYRSDGIVRAAAPGPVQNVFQDPTVVGRFTVVIEHVVGDHHYRTLYTNIVTLSSDILIDEVVRAGQPLGTAGNAGVHFQVDDLEYYREMGNPNAVSPEPFLTAAAKSLFDGLFIRATFAAELVEPFATNPRALAFPASRTWTRAGGDGPAGIRFTRRSARSDVYDYALLAESLSPTETGTVVLNTTARPATIDLVSPVSRRLGVYDIVSNELRLSLASAGTARPADLSGATIYRTTR